MKPFRFPLQPLRVLREQKEQAAQKTYAEALRDCERAATSVRNASMELDDAWTVLNQEIAKGATGIQLLRLRAWCNVLELRVRDHTRDLERARENSDAMWQALMIATRNRESLEELHDRKRRAHERESQRAEQNMIDELAVQMMGAAGAAPGVRAFAR